MITSSGNIVVGVDRKTGFTKIYRAQEDGFSLGATLGTGRRAPRQLVGSVPESDAILFRDHRGALAILDAQEGTTRILTPRTDLKVRVFGSNRLIVEAYRDDGHSQLRVIPFDRPNDAFWLGDRMRWKAVELAPSNRFLFATSSGDRFDETYVFDLTDGDVVDRFAGSIAIGRNGADPVAGLRASSPSGDRLAYRTPSGSAALRDLAKNGSCLIRQAGAQSEHRVVGFNPTGQVVLESEGKDARFTRVMLYQPRLQTITQLGETGVKLAAAPAQTSKVSPWVIGYRDGSPMRLSPDAQEASLGDFGEASFDPRDDGTVFVIQTTVERGRRKVRIDSVSPKGVDPSVLQFDRPSTDFMCLATAQPGGWSSRCGASRTAQFFAASSRPASEMPGSDLGVDASPELPQPPTGDTTDSTDTDTDTDTDEQRPDDDGEPDSANGDSDGQASGGDDSGEPDATNDDGEPSQSADDDNAS